MLYRILKAGLTLQAIFIANVLLGQVAVLPLNSTLTPGDYIARDEINVLPGTTITPTGTNQMHLYIDKSIVLPVAYTGAGALPSDLSRVLDFSLPVGSTPILHDVSELGEATFSIPIFSSPGTKRLAPKISIDYSSMAGVGLAGYGWNISGLQAITRMPRTIYHNSEVQGIALTNDDWFALTQNRLVPVSGTNGSNGAIYNTEVETYSRVTSYGIVGSGPEWFKVETKDGLIIEMGNTTDSRLIPDGKTTVSKWMINKIQDLHGNYMTFHYNNANGQQYLIEIKYTGNGTSKLPYNSLKFYYDERTDKTMNFVAGGELKSDVILRNIDVVCEGVVVKSYDFKYNINEGYSYLNEIIEHGADYTHLNSLLFNYHADLETAPILEQSELEYVDLSDTGLIKKYIPVDIDQDGKKDLVTLKGDIIPGLGPFDGVTSTYANTIWFDWDVLKNNGDNTFDNVSNANAFPASFAVSDALYPFDKTSVGNMSYETTDVNGDGNDDVVFTTYEPGYTSDGGVAIGRVRVYPYLSTGSGFTAPLVGYTEPSASAGASENFSLRLMDFNGDQKLDVFNYHKNLMTGYDTYGNPLYTGFYRIWLDATNPTPTYFFASSTFDFSKSFPLDLNGDGKSELVNIHKYDNSDGYDEGVYTMNLKAGSVVFDLDSSGFSYSEPGYQNGGGPFGSFSIELLGDYNADGISDVMRAVTAPPPTGVTWKIYYGKGDGSYKPVDVTTHGFNDPYDYTGTVSDPQYKNFYISRDVNMDGRSDILEFNKGTTYSTINIHYNYPSGFVKQAYPLDFLIVRGQYDINFGDFNGDGVEDMLIHGYELDKEPRIIYFYKGARSRLIKQNLTGHNIKTEFSYEPITGSTDVYNRTQTVTYPLNIPQSPLYVVDEMKTEDGADGESITTYKYQDLVFHKNGKGILGFLKVISENNNTGFTKTSSYNFNSTYFVNLLEQQKIQITSTSANISKVDYSYTTTGLPLGRVAINQIQVINTDYIKGFTVATDLSYDTYGNVLESSTDYSGKETKEIESTYVLAGSWIPSKEDMVTTTVTRLGESPFTTTEEFTYNSNGDIINSITNSFSDKSVSVDFDYDIFGNIKQLDVTPNLLPTSTDKANYDTRGRFLVHSENALNQISTYTMDNRWGTRTSETAVDGLTTTNQADAWGRPFKSSSVTGVTTTQTLNWASTPPTSDQDPLYIIESITPGLPNTKTYYDKFGREVKTETEGLNETIFTQITYDNKGNKATVAAPHFSAESPVVTSFSYDELNRCGSVSNSAGTATYDFNAISLGYEIVYTNPAGQVTSITKDATNKAIKTTDEGGTVLTDYFSNGKPKSVSVNGVTVNQMTYDDIGNRTSLTDNAAGTITYEYDAAAKLISQTDARSNTYTFEYNLLGDLTKRTGPEGTTDYIYYTSGTATNKLSSEVTSFGHTVNYLYDSYGRRTDVEEIVDGVSYLTKTAYNIYNKEIKTVFPSGFEVKYLYNPNGILTGITNTDGSVNIVTFQEMDSKSKYTKFLKGNGILSEYTYDEFGFPVSFQAGSIQDLNFNFDPASRNLLSKTDDIKGLTETFDFDNLNRLTSYQVTGQPSIDLTYEPNGNIASKSGLGNYVYDLTKKNAVIGVDNTDGIISTNQQDISYNGFNKIEHITEGDYEYTVYYGSDQQRRKTVLEYTPTSSIESTRYYFGCYEKNTSGTLTQEIHYIKAGNELIGMYVIENGVGNYYYSYNDYQGSILTITDDAGNVVGEKNFDPWGRERDADDWTYTVSNTSPSWLWRGYTGHEHLPEFALINMNGRAYDPILGRMLSPDNYVQDVTMTQNFNRFSYAFNNPTIYADPDGDFIWFIAIAWIGWGIGSNIYDHWDDIQAEKTTGGKWWKGIQYGLVGGITSAFEVFTGPAGAAFANGFKYLANEGIDSKDDHLETFDNLFTGFIWNTGLSYITGIAGKGLSGKLTGKMLPGTSPRWMQNFISQFTGSLAVSWPSNIASSYYQNAVDADNQKYSFGDAFADGTYTTFSPRGLFQITLSSAYETGKLEKQYQEALKKSIDRTEMQTVAPKQAGQIALPDLNLTLKTLPILPAPNGPVHDNIPMTGRSKPIILKRD